MQSEVPLRESHASSAPSSCTCIGVKDDGRTHAEEAFDISLDNDTAMNCLSGGDGDENIQLTRRGFCRQH